MLILSRNIGQKIIIGDDIEVQVLSMGRGQIRLGINAPTEVPVYREEIYQRIQQEKYQVSQAIK